MEILGKEGGIDMGKTIILELTEKRLAKISRFLREQYEFDSLDLVECILKAEEVFGVEIPSVGDIEWME